jgi:hypothetical protein
MTSDATTTTEERACCRMMKSQCGQMEMPASHDCCKKAPKSFGDSALKTNAVSLHPTAFVALWVSSFELVAPEDATIGWFRRPEHSPPKAPPPAITILRI